MAKTSVEVFYSQLMESGSERREIIGKFEASTGTYTTESGQTVRLDLSGVRPSLRRSKNIEVQIDQFKHKTIALNRDTGLGYQTVATGWRLGVMFDSVKGVLKP